MTARASATRTATGRGALSVLGAITCLLVFVSGLAAELELHSPVDGRHHEASCAHDAAKSAAGTELDAQALSPDHRDACPPCVHQRVGRVTPTIAHDTAVATLAIDAAMPPSDPPPSVTAVRRPRGPPHA